MLRIEINCIIENAKVLSTAFNYFIFFNFPANVMDRSIFGQIYHIFHLSPFLLFTFQLQLLLFINFFLIMK